MAPLEVGLFWVAWVCVPQWEERFLISALALCSVTADALSGPR